MTAQEEAMYWAMLAQRAFMIAEGYTLFPYAFKESGVRLIAHAYEAGERHFAGAT